MALLEIDFKSKALKRSVQFNVILPVEKFRGPYPTLYLLHGLTNNRNGWLHNTRIRMWAENLGLAVVMPSGDNSFYQSGKSTTPDRLDQTWMNCVNLFDAEYNV